MFEFPETSPVAAAFDSALLCFSEQKMVSGPVLLAIIISISSGSKIACLLFDFQLVKLTQINLFVV